MSDGNEQGSDFWSRRKAAVREAEEEERLQQEAVKNSQQRAELETKTDAEILEKLDLPEPELLTEKDDFTRFLSEAVPERLKRRALRRLWGLDPVLANLDGLVDYGEDYTDAATVIANMQTAYKVGRGMIDRFAEALEDNSDEEGIAELQGIGEQSANADAAECEGNAAPHNDLDQYENTYIQLTPAETLVQDGGQRVDSFDSEDFSPDENEGQHRPRRRMRFDYS